MDADSEKIDASSAPERGDRADFRRELLDWYDRHRRELPWRGVEDPYATWVAEVMLQQTRVGTVVDYYERWMDRFPDVESVAEADREDVLELWEGLGFYRRARFLHRSARMLIEEHDGCMPTEVDALQQLPGIGPYTAGAIASIAFGRETPVVDGNVSRVLSRLFAIEGDPTDRANEKRYWALAEALVGPDRPGDFNQAMMELGATVCTAQSPSCLLCPVREHCRAFAQGDPEAYPDTIDRARQKPVDVATCVVVAESEEGSEATYLVKRDADGLLGGLWEFPTVEVEDEDAADERLDELLGETLGLAEAREASDVDAGELTHLFSHIRLTIDVRVRRIEVSDGRGGRDRGLEGRDEGWLAVDALESVPMSTAMRRVERQVFGAADDQS